MDKSFLQHVINQDLLSVLNGPDSVRRFAAEQLQRSITKKWVDSNEDASRAAIKLFKDVNSIVGTLILDPTSDLIIEMRRLAEKHFAPFADDFDWQFMLADSGICCGAGASARSHGQNSVFEKLFVNELTASNPFLYTEYLRYLAQHDSFLRAEYFRAHRQGHVKLVNFATLSTVPKTSAISRTIMTEPSLNMIFQRALAVFIDTKLLKRAYGYDSALQPDRNRNLARLGSIMSNIATIDLSSASDFVSCRLVDMVLPKALNIAISDCRVGVASVDGELVTLNMVSGMGNGFTFSLQTYVFSLLVEAVCRLEKRQFHRFDKFGTRFGTFGDDIIVPDDIATKVIQGLKSLGFVPNVDKSYHGITAFRESCGTDWYSGVDVRGVYCKGLGSDQERYSLVNRLIRWSATHSIALNRTIESLLPGNWRNHCIPNDFADDAGVKTPRAPYWYKRRVYGFKVNYFSPKIKRFSVLLRRGALDDVLKPSHDNVLGFVIAATLMADPSHLPRRQERTAYAKARKFVPYWHVHSAGDGMSYALWEMAVFRHLDV